MKKLIAGAALFAALCLPAMAAGNYTYAANVFSVTHTGGAIVDDGVTKIKTGDTIEVTALGTPGAKLTYDIGPNAEGNAMTETSPGHYVGKFTLEPRHFIHERIWLKVHASQEGVNKDFIDGRPIVLEP